MSTNPDDYEGQTVLILGRGETQIKMCFFAKVILLTMLEKYPYLAESSNYVF